MNAQNNISKITSFLNNLWQDKNYRLEVERKIFHILVILSLPIFYIFTSKLQILAILAPLTAIVAAADFYRHRLPAIKKIFNIAFGHILREHEMADKGWTGATFVMLSALITFAIFPKNIAICAFIILAVSDCLAALVGKGVKSKEFFEKSLAGSIAFGVSGFLILLICGLFTGQSLAYYFFGTFAVFVTTIIEARPSFLNFDDNFTIPISFASVMMFFALLWDLQF
jgi:dolichol kinase